MKISEHSIEEHEEIKLRPFYFTAIRYFYSDQWTAGPAGHNKDELLDTLAAFRAVEARLYKIKLPVIFSRSERKEGNE